MTFSLPYISKGRQHRRIEMPDYYLGFVSTEDVKQLRFGLRLKIQNEPSIAALKNSAIALAKQRKENKCG